MGTSLRRIGEGVLLVFLDASILTVPVMLLFNAAKAAGWSQVAFGFIVLLLLALYRLARSALRSRADIVKLRERLGRLEHEFHSARIALPEQVARCSR